MPTATRYWEEWPRVIRPHLDRDIAFVRAFASR